MSVFLLNLFFRFSGYTFNLKQKIVKADNWLLVIPYAILLIASELGFILVSLPVYLLVPPNKVQEEGFIFPKAISEEPTVKTYTIRRKITLTTIFGAGGILVIKIVFVGLASFFVFGLQQLLADTQDWTFSVPGDYTYNSAKIEITGGVAQLKDNVTTTTGTTTNPGFNTATTGWTGADWGAGGGEVNPTQTRVTTGGNPGGWVNINVPAGSNDELGGYWQQSFTTTVANPTSTINFDWQVSAYDSTPAPITFKLYVFVDNVAGAPTIGQEVWSSGEITSTSGWASISNLDVSSKITTAGTYYVKVAMWVETPGTNSGPFTVGYDNILLTWTKTTHTYASDSPTTTPITALSVPKAVSWNAFNETATKNGGEIYYQMSADNGANWQYHNGTNWATTTSITAYNTAIQVNSNIASFATSTNQIKWRAYLVGNGTQQVILDNVGITYTQNQRPVVANLTPAQNTNYGYVHVNYDLQDTESDPSSLTAYEYSPDNINWFTMTASTTDPAHSGVTGLTTAPAGIAHNFVWDAKTQLGNVYNANVYVRLRPNDGIANGTYATSSSFAVDYATSTISNVVAVQNLGTTTVSVTYDLFDNTTDNILVEAQISGDGGSTWTVATSTLTGAIGASVTSGNGKTISWNALTDYPGQQKNNLQIRLRAKDKFQNQGNYTASANFSLDTLTPATLVTASLLAQPLAGDTTVLISGSFTETNPNTNDFYVALNGGAYGTSTAGGINTAAPANQNTNTGSILTGHDVISKIKVVHTDDYGLTFTNENTTPNIAYKYVKPYTPQAPTLNNPVTNRLDLLINPNVNEASDVEYAIFETSQNKYVQSDGTLGTNPVWQVRGTTSGQWGSGLGITGKVRITGLTSPVSLYTFKVKSRNPNDAAHAATSESVYSATASIPNTAPVIALDSYAQTTDGTQYTNINYTGTDGQGDINNIATYEYSTDNSTWQTMTEKSGAGSNGVSNLVFLPTGSAYKFVWDSALNLPNIEDATVYARLRANDTQVNGNLAASAAFEIDNKTPIITSVTASQNTGAKTVAINYNLADANNSLIQIDISSDGGSTWTVATSSITGAIGNGVTPGAKTATWNAGVNFDDQYNTQMKVRVRARDSFGNQSSYVVSASNFTVDTHAPILSNIIATQDNGAKTFTFHYDVSEDIGNATVVLEISSNSGSTWVIPITSASGDTGAVTPGTNKTITWNAGTDYNNQEKLTMKIRLTATDGFTNNRNLSSADFSLDSQAPRITNVTAAQTLASTSVVFHYDLADQNTSDIALDISSDGGSTWTVTDTSVTGDVSSNIAAGTNKTIIWNAALDFPNQDISTMRLRVRGTDIYNNASGNATSTNFLVDTLAPATNVVANLLAQPLAGNTSILIGGSFTESHPDINNFYAAINGDAYGLATAGTTNTDSPANQLTTVAALDGNDYISQVKITHTDDYGQTVTNENNSPNTTYKYVKPYTPPVPTVNNPGIGTVDVTINKHASETDGLEYAIFESSQNKYVQSDGTLGTNPVWQTLGTGAGQWGSLSGLAGKINVSGLTTHSYLYQFQIKSRNTSDASHASTSESALSSGASSANQSPVITIDYLGQSISGGKYVTINYTGSDLESETVNLTSYQYSTDNSTWHTMTEKSGVGSSGISGLAFTYPGTAYNFVWDVGTDLNNIEDNTVYVRLRANDGTSNGGLTASSAFTVDTKNPSISTVTASQTINSNNVIINYNLTDLSNSTIELQISNDGGSTWTVATSTATGDLGININPDTGKTISWNPGIDYSGQEDNDLKVRIKATDNFGNAGVFTSSSNFSIDTKSPAITNISVSQNAGNNTVAISYDINDANSSTVALDISNDGGSTWTVTDTSVSGAIGSGITSGTGKTITWNAGTDFAGWEINNMRVRLRATDTHNNATGDVESANFTLDTKAPTITNITAAQVLATDNVNFGYSLADNDNVQIIMEISANSGSTWTVATSSLAGAIGSGVTPGNNKLVIWNAATDYNNHENDVMKVRVRGVDSFNNISDNVELTGLFSVDTLAPTTNVTANLTAQPNAGDNTVSINGSFTESHPNTNDFLVAINGANYNATTTGEANTATPANQNTNVGSTLTGNDYISKVKLTHVDDYNHLGTNENTTPSVSYKYVKPYTPPAPAVNTPQNTSVDLTINHHASESSAVEYAIYEVSTGKYVQANGSLGASPVWKIKGTGVGQWGNLSGEAGKITVTGLTSPVANYSFMVKSRNPQDSLHAISSESAYSAVASIINTAPNINIISASQSLTGSYTNINYTGTDAQNDTNNLTVYEYSINGSTWQAMTEKSGVGSDGTTGLIFASTGTNYTFAWDTAADLPNQEQATVYIRIMSTDTLTNSNLAASSAFYTDTRGPVITNLNIYQTPASSIVTFEYTLNDSAGSDNTVVLDISNDGGSTYTIATSTLTGDIGSGVTSGSNRTITWNAGVDFAGQESSIMKIKIRGTDKYGNTGSYTNSDNFAVDAKTPIISGLTANQVIGSDNITINYNLTDSTPAGHLVEFSISNNSGLTWDVATTTVSGEIGSGQTTGAKSFTWNAGVDFANQNSATMKVRVRAKDYFNNQGAYASSSDFSVDTLAPVITNITASQATSTTSVAINYDLAETATTTLDISSDGGLTWTVAKTSLTGALGLVTAGTNKLVNWNATIDFGNQENSTMRIRIKGVDNFGNNSIYYESGNFTVDTAAPLGLLSLSKFSSTPTSVSLNWQTNTDAHFNHYELWHGTNLGDVNNRTGSASKWDTTNDSNLNNPLTAFTVITGINLTSSYYIRIWAIDNYGNEITVPAIDAYDAPVISNISANQALNSDTVDINYNLADNNSSVQILIDISADNGATWTVATSTLAGDSGSNIAPGNNKLATWNAGVDYNNHQTNTMKVRLHGIDSDDNTSSYFELPGSFSIDTLSPVNNITANLKAQPNAGDTVALIGGSFTETNPNTNDFYLAINNGNYGAATVGGSNTATPADTNTAVSTILTGHDYISKVKITHTDDYGHVTNNENLTPATNYKYVKPYTPSIPTVNNPQLTSVDLTINHHINEANDVEYAIYESSTNKYVQSNGTLGGSPVWQVMGTGAGQWGNLSSLAGKITITGLTSPVNNYSFAVKSRNPSDTAHATTSESTLSGSASTDNQTPVISINNINQTTDGTKYVVINYDGSDLESETSQLTAYEYSTDNSNWQTMTEKTGVGSDGINGLAFNYPGTNHNFMWDVAADLNNIEDNTVYIRLKANDGHSDGGVAVSSAFIVDTKNPTITNITANQTLNSNNVTINYNLVDLSNSTILSDISGDTGITWNIATSTFSGEIGSNITPNNGRIINWNPGIDYSGQEDNSLITRIKAIDNFGNIGIFATSSNFSVDTKAPTFANVVSVFNNNGTVTTTYDLSDANNSTLVLDISADGGTTWSVTDTSVSGAIGSDIASGTNKTITWNAAIDFPSQTISNMRTRLKATDRYNNATGYVESNDFALNTQAQTPVVNLTATGGGGAPTIDNLQPNQPILNSLITPTRNTLIRISGLAEPRSKVELYDNNNLIGILDSLADNNGLFGQDFNFLAGNHSLNIRAIDSTNNISSFSNTVTLNIITTIPTKPIILVPQNNIIITSETPQIIGVADANTQIILTIDNNEFTINSDNNGAWSFIVPNTFALTDGPHTISAIAKDTTNISSEPAITTITKITILTPIATLPPVTTPGVTPVIPPVIISTSTPSEETVSLPATTLISDTTGATELPGIPVPRVMASQANVTATGDIISFTGTSLPNFEIVAYIHSDQALIYRTRTDENGNWRINHSQTISELAPGDHTIYAIALDANAKVKSKPSAVSSFKVERNFWVMIFKYLNWPTTAVTLIILIITIWWLHRIKNKRKA